MHALLLEELGSFAQSQASGGAPVEQSFWVDPGVRASRACATSEVIFSGIATPSPRGVCYEHVGQDAVADDAERYAPPTQDQFFCSRRGAYLKLTTSNVAQVRQHLLERYDSTCTITSISTVILLGSEAMPTADRA
jgi:hypothetical protein